MPQGPDDRRNILARAFHGAASKTWSKIDFCLTHYPSKTLAVFGGMADTVFLGAKVAEGSWVGIAAGTLGLAADALLLLYGDPKIPKEQLSHYQDPQDNRDEPVLRIPRRPEEVLDGPRKFVWEHVGLMRLMTMGLMCFGGTGIASPQASYGEITYGGTAILGYLLKIGISERPPGSVQVSKDSLLQNGIDKGKAFILENPNATAGALWMLGLTPYMAEGIIDVMKGEGGLKLAAASLYMVCDSLVMHTRKRAQVLPDIEARGPQPPRA